MVRGKVIAALLCGVAAFETDDQVVMIQKVNEPSLETDSDPAFAIPKEPPRIHWLEDRFGFPIDPFPGRVPEEYEGMDEPTKEIFRKFKLEYEAPYKYMKEFPRAYAPLSKNRFNATKFFLKDILVNHGQAISSMYARPNEGGFVQLNELDASQSQCSQKDKMALRTTLTSMMEGDHEECSLDSILGEKGINQQNLNRCIRASAKVSEPCSQCFVDLAAVATGTPENPQCSMPCVMNSAWCQDGPGKVCFRKMSECFQCTRDAMANLATCTGMDAQKAFKRAYEDLPELIFYGNISEAGILQITMARAALAE